MKLNIFKEKVIEGTINMIEDQTGELVTREDVTEYLKAEKVDLYSEFKFLRECGHI